MVGEDDIQIEMKKIKFHSEIWNFVSPICTYVTRRRCMERDIYINLCCQCEWEKEQGLQLVFRQIKKLPGVSQEDGHLTDADASDKLGSQNYLLSMF